MGGPTVSQAVAQSLPAVISRRDAEQLLAGISSLIGAGHPGAPHTDPETADFVVVDLNASRCGEYATAVPLRSGCPTGLLARVRDPATTARAA
jgi:hypothetical protein